MNWKEYRKGGKVRLTKKEVDYLKRKKGGIGKNRKVNYKFSGMLKLINANEFGKRIFDEGS